MKNALRSLTIVAFAVSAGSASAALTGHFVSNDWTGSGAWANRVTGNTDATIANGTPALVAAGANASQAGVNFIDFGGASSFNVLGSGAANPLTGLNDFAITVVFSLNGIAQVDGTDNRWWTQAGLIGNEFPGGNRSDVGLTVDVGNVVGALSDTRDYDYLRGAPTVVDTSMHVATLVRQNTNFGSNSADLELWLDGVLVDSFSGTPGGDALVGNPLETADGSFPDGFAIGANLTDFGVGDYRSFNGHIAEIQIDDDGGIDVAALHGGLVQGGIYQIPEPSSSLLALAGVAFLGRRARKSS